MVHVFAPVEGFCRCPKPASQRRGFPVGDYRVNVLPDASDLDNPKIRCATCGSTYSAAAPKAVA